MFLKKSFKFESKAQTLNKIKKITKNQFIVPRLFFITKKNFLNNKIKFFKKINSYFKDDIILRSSSLDEDKSNGSNAGKYNSFVIRDFKKKKFRFIH